MMNKKAQFLLRDWIVATILFSGIISLLMINVGSLATRYDNTDIVSQEFQDNFNKFDESTGKVQEIWNEVSSKEGLSPVAGFELLFKSGFAVLSLVFTSVVSAGSQLFGFTEFFGIPSEVGFIFFTIVFSILSVIIAFVVLSSTSRRDL